MTQPTPHEPSKDNDPIAAAAAHWVMREDRGLTAEEQDAFLEWLAADPRHGEALARRHRTWETFDRLAGLQSSLAAEPDPDLLQPRETILRPGGSQKKSAPLLWLAVPLAAAACIAVAVLWSGRKALPERVAPMAANSSPATLAAIEERVLADGSKIRLNRDARIVIDFSETARRVRLDAGEAAFEVMKDAARPFVVNARGVSVQAIGTAFNLRLGENALEVIVTEGKIAVSPTVGQSPTLAAAAGERAVVSLAPEGRAEIGAILPDELARRLAWQPRTLTFTDEPLSTILNEFNRHNPVSLRIGDADLRDLRLSVRFRSDNVSGFLRLLESEFGVRNESITPGEVLLRRAR